MQKNGWIKMALFEVGLENDFKGGQRKIVDINGKSVAVIYCDGVIVAFENICPHRQGNVGNGEIEDCIITCPLHGWQFDVKTGEGKTMPNSKLNMYPVKVQEGKVFVEE